MHHIDTGPCLPFLYKALAQGRQRMSLSLSLERLFDRSASGCPREAMLTHSFPPMGGCLRRVESSLQELSLRPHRFVKGETFNPLWSEHCNLGSNIASGISEYSTRELDKPDPRAPSWVGYRHINF